MTDAEKIKKYDEALNLISEIFDTHTNDNAADRACRNIARRFYSLLTNETVQFEIRE